MRQRKHLGGLDGLINNARDYQLRWQGAWANISSWTPGTCVMDVNVRGTWLTTVAAQPHLAASRQFGRVVNLASDTALWGAHQPAWPMSPAREP